MSLLFVNMVPGTLQDDIFPHQQAMLVLGDFQPPFPMVKMWDSHPQRSATLQHQGCSWKYCRPGRRELPSQLSEPQVFHGLKEEKHMALPGHMGL